MQIELGRTPRPEEIAAIEYQARQLRAQVVRDLFTAAGRYVLRLVRSDSQPGGRAASA